MKQRQYTINIWLLQFYIGINQCADCVSKHRGSGGLTISYNYEGRFYQQIFSIIRHGRSISIGR